MVGKIHARREKRKTPGKKFETTTYKSGGRVKKQSGGPMTGGALDPLGARGSGVGTKAGALQSMARRPSAALGQASAAPQRQALTRQASSPGRGPMSTGTGMAEGRGAYPGAGTMVKKGGSIKKAKGGKVKAMHGGMKAKKKK